MNTDYQISTNDLASIEQYLLGELTAEQQRSFEAQLSTDELLAAKVHEVSLLLAGIETASLKERLNHYHSNLPTTAAHQAGGKLMSFPKKWLAAACITVVAATAIWLYSNSANKYDKLYASYYKPDPGLMSAMGVGDNYLFNKAMLDYKTGLYKQAITGWNSLKKNGAPNDTLYYFLGVAHQADGNSDTALALLQSMASDSTKPFYRDACWYTGLALLKKGQLTEAIPYLEKSDRPESVELISQIK